MSDTKDRETKVQPGDANAELADVLIREANEIVALEGTNDHYLKSWMVSAAASIRLCPIEVTTANIGELKSNFTGCGNAVEKKIIGILKVN